MCWVLVYCFEPNDSLIEMIFVEDYSLLFCDRFQFLHNQANELTCRLANLPHFVYLVMVMKFYLCSCLIFSPYVNYLCPIFLLSFLFHSTVLQQTKDLLFTLLFVVGELFTYLQVFDLDEVLGMRNFSHVDFGNGLEIFL